jgi:endopolyphosphatase
VPSYGNNDVWPYLPKLDRLIGRHNIFAPGPNYQTRSYASLWADMIPEYELHTFERGGYFAVEVVPNKLAILSLNTLYWFDFVFGTR